ncbi:precorrin-4 C(11)-methyltransferase [uncultured Megasphaera sp.]|uniref:precorrin-4 C(11)-methyltransferase n=1 Tax=uncultured Megasphaera sp. TaxID=165188 RepID=UPI002593BF41|nr:precorrin-4 C(11)-methyltransferase [uncultured Megasphaera sp.]
MIHFVGAGPGAADLITVRGKTLLETADQIIYAGSLVNPDLLQYAKAGCRILDSASMTLEEVIAAMKEYEAKGAMTVRLHTGDPSIYGAIREQMDELDKAGIAYACVPGVSSFCAAAAAVQKEYTLPGISQSVIITRMEERTGVPEHQKIADYAAHGATMVIFLSAGLLEKLETELQRGGYAAATPAAIVYKASWPDEKVCYCTVDTLARTAAANGISRTALILVGHFLDGAYERSRLYDPAFTHGYRQGKDAK